MSDDGKYIVPIRKGKGIIETSILPVTNSFFTYKRFQERNISPNFGE
jgi:hypothetical protein